MLTISQLFVYPIKSLGGISVPSATITARGFEYDRRWMLVDANNRFITQRELPEMAMLQVEIKGDGLKVYHKKNVGSPITLPFLVETTEAVMVEIFEERCEAIFVSKIADEWFSSMLSAECRLVYMPDSTNRLVDNKYAGNNEITTFTDGFPFLLIGQSSLDDLNARLSEPLPINRFRPNIVFKGGSPFEEDTIEHFTVNAINFYCVKPCARCAITTVNQDNANRSKEPLSTLATYRQKNNNVYFGQNLLAKGVGTLNIGDQMQVKKVNSTGMFGNL
jgi:MOSC domain-containing protein